MFLLPTESVRLSRCY